MMRWSLFRGTVNTYNNIGTRFCRSFYVFLTASTKGGTHEISLFFWEKEALLDKRSFFAIQIEFLRNMSLTEYVERQTYNDMQP